MKRMLLLTLGLLNMTNIAFAQPGSIALSSDRGELNCHIYDNAPGLVTFYVLHLFTAGATSSHFMVKPHDGVILTWLADTVTPPFISIGNSQKGIMITYGSCLAHPIHILTITYIGHGLSEECSWLSVAPSPAAVSPHILVTDCHNPPNLIRVTGGHIVINPNYECYCNIKDPDPVEQTSWGQVKALYQ